MSHVVPRAVALLMLAAAACAHAPRTLSATHISAMRDSVQETLGLFRRYSAASQWDSLSRLYVDDARFRWVENGMVRYRSAAEIHQALAALPPNTRIESTYQDTEIIPIAPGIASVVTRFQTRIADFSFGGAITMMLIHRDDGWRILGGHTSAPQPRPR